MRRISAGIIVTRKNTHGEIEVLMQLKRKKEVSLGLYYTEWEFPGGKLDGTETAAECARRELWEEIGIEAKELNQLLYIDHQDKFGCVMFFAAQWNGTPQLKEPDKQPAIGWFALDSLPTHLTLDAKASIEAGVLEGLI